MNNNQIDAYRTLKDGGVSVQERNQIRFNSGSETIPHVVCKSLAAYVGHLNGYRVSSEVELENGGEIDTVLWGHPDRLSYAVEIEQSPKSEVVADKLDRYVRITPIDELCVINPGSLPMDMVECAGEIADEMGLEL